MPSIWIREFAYTHVFKGCSGGASCKESSCQCRRCSASLRPQPQCCPSFSLPSLSHLPSPKRGLSLLKGNVALVVKICLPMQETRDVGSVPGSGRSLGGGNGSPLQYSCLEIPMDRGAWRATVHEVAKSQTKLKQLSTHARMHNWSSGIFQQYFRIWKQINSNNYKLSGLVTHRVVQPSPLKEILTH